MKMSIEAVDLELAPVGEAPILLKVYVGEFGLCADQKDAPLHVPGGDALDLASGLAGALGLGPVLEGRLAILLGMAERMLEDEA